MGGVSVAVGVLSLIGAAVLATVGNMAWPRVVVALVLTGVAGILNGSFGPAIHRAVTTADGKASQVIGQFTGTAVTGLLAIVAFAALAFWVWRDHIDTRTLAVAAVVPATVTMIPGAFGTVATAVVGFVPLVVSAVLRFAFGIG